MNDISVSFVNHSARQCVCMCVCVSVCLPMSVSVFVYLSLSLFVCLSIYLSISIFLLIFLSMRLSILLSLSLYTFDHWQLVPVSVTILYQPLRLDIGPYIDVYRPLFLQPIRSNWTLYSPSSITNLSTWPRSSHTPFPTYHPKFNPVDPFAFPSSGSRSYVPARSRDTDRPIAPRTAVVIRNAFPSIERSHSNVLFSGRGFVRIRRSGYNQIDTLPSKASRRNPDSFRFPKR